MSLMNHSTPGEGEDSQVGFSREVGRTSSAAVYAQWTTRVSTQPESVVARDLSGLTDDELSALACEFVQAPQRKRTDRLRFAVPTGISICAIAAFGMLIHFGFVHQPDAPASNLLLLSISLFIVGVIAICVGSLAAYTLVATENAYSKLGQLVTVLDEHHGWLYKAYQLRLNPAAEEYRHRVLRDRGALRGVDFVMMRELAHAHENLELIQSARTIAVRLQHLPEHVEAAQAGHEPRVVSIHNTPTETAEPVPVDRRATGTAAVRTFGSTPGGAFA